MRNKKTNWKKELRNIGTGIVFGLCSLLNGCGSNGQIIDKNLIKKPYIETAVVSDYVAKHGVAIRGQVRQDLISADLNDRLSAFVWQNYCHATNDFNERDVGVSYSVSITDNLSARAGYQHWHYPHDYFGEDDRVLKAGASLKSAVNLDFDVTHLLPHDNTEHGTRYYLKASKSFDLGELNEWRCSITPSLSACEIDNYYGNSGLSQVTPGINLGMSKGRFSANFFINKQVGQVSGIKDLTWGGMGIGYQF